MKKQDLTHGKTAHQRAQPHGDATSRRAGLLKRRLIGVWAVWCVVLLVVGTALERAYAGSSLAFRFIFPVWELTAVAAYLGGTFLLARDFGDSPTKGARGYANDGIPGPGGVTSVDPGGRGKMVV